MKVNFVFDEFKDDEPYWNLCDISINRHVDYRLMPRNVFWWFESVKNVLSYDNDLETHENELHFVKTLEHEFNKEDINIYPVFISDRTFQFPNCLLWLPSHIVTQINDGSLYLMVTNYFETDFINHGEFVNKLTQLLDWAEVRNFKNVKIVGCDFISARIINNECYNPKKIKYIVNYTFEKFYARRLVKLNPGFNFDDHINVVNKKNTFLMQIGSPRNFRYLNYKVIEYNGLLENALYSYMPFGRGMMEFDSLGRYINECFYGDPKRIEDQLNEDKNKEFYEWLKINDKIYERNLPGCKMDNSDVYNTSPYTNIDWLKDTYFSVIMETQVNNLNSFITEKTFKMIFCGHPFILIASPGALKELHNLGYETYPELFDESYDDMPQSFEKMFFIANQIKKWTLPENRQELEEKIKLIKPKLLKNRSVYLSKDHSKFWNNFVDKIKLI
jgi:hypothetical protein